MKLLQLKIILSDVRPPVWRRVVLSPELTLAKLHRVVQVAMGWEDAHLHLFRAGTRLYSDPRFELEDGSADERKVRIGELFSAPGSRVLYKYDFGDGWLHELLCEELIESDVQPPYAVCIGGARHCPPENCGGPDGYTELLEALRKKNHRKYQEAREWLGSRFDPEAFSVEYASAALTKLFRRKKAI